MLPSVILYDYSVLVVLVSDFASSFDMLMRTLMMVLIVLRR